MEKKKQKLKLDGKTIVSLLLVLAVIYLLASGRLNLLGGGGQEGGESLPMETRGSVAQSQEASPATTQTKEASSTAPPATTGAYKTYTFRNSKLLNEHFEKHGKEMGFKSAKEYEKAACDVINNPAALYKTEKEDGDHVYYIVATNEFVVLSKDGYIRTYFLPSSGKAYFDRQ